MRIAMTFVGRILAAGVVRSNAIDNMTLNQQPASGVSHQLFGVAVAAIALAIVWVGMHLHDVNGDLSTTVIGAVLFVGGIAIACYGFLMSGRAP